MPNYICHGNDCFNNKANNYGRFSVDQSIDYCPRCGSDEIIWVPPRFKGNAKEVDKTLDRVAKQYNLGNMGKRGGTREGEFVKQRPPDPEIHRIHNVNGIQVPVSKTGEVTSGWSPQSLAPKVGNMKAGSPYAGLRPGARIPTNIRHVDKGAA